MAGKKGQKKGSAATGNPTASSEAPEPSEPVAPKADVPGANSKPTPTAAGVVTSARAPTVEPAKPTPTRTVLSATDLLTRFIEVVVATAHAKGWGAEVSNRDAKTHRYASVDVWRDDVVATVELSIETNGDVRYPIHPEDKFNTRGLPDLQLSIAAAVAAQPWIAKKSKGAPASPALDVVLDMLSRFHAVAKQLRKRHDDRPTIDVKDEYDVQDILHALLRSRFDDVRPEEASPSHAGANSRIDFLLKKERITVEAKMTRATLRDKQVGEELIVDIARYQKHPDCDTLVCFVYDPSGYLSNAAGLERDLSGKKDRLNVRVVVTPK